MSDRYTPYYCEENVWWLAQDQRFAGSEADVVVISNPCHSVLTWSQRAARTPGDPIVWDYHVVLAVRRADGVEISDLDCTLGAPLSATTWLDATFDPRTPASHAPSFRLIEAGDYVARFASDRRHMRTASGEWHARPPPWPIIGGGAHVLDRLIDPNDTTFSPWIDLAALRARWRASRSA